MKGLLGINRAVDGLNNFIGRWVAWAIFGAVVISTVNAIIRKVLNTSLRIRGSKCSGCCSAQSSCFAPRGRFQSNEHIRIDVVSSFLSRQVLVDRRSRAPLLPHPDVPCDDVLLVAVLLPLAFSERAVHECRGAAGLSGQIPCATWVLAASPAGHIRVDQTHSDHARRTRRRVGRWPPRRLRKPRRSVYVKRSLKRRRHVREPRSNASSAAADDPPS